MKVSGGGEGGGKFVNEVNGAIHTYCKHKNLACSRRMYVKLVIIQYLYLHVHVSGCL